MSQPGRAELLLEYLWYESPRQCHIPGTCTGICTLTNGKNIDYIRVGILLSAQRLPELRVGLSISLQSNPFIHQLVYSSCIFLDIHFVQVILFLMLGLQMGKTKIKACT
jgi:hypothetical protein